MRPRLLQSLLVAADVLVRARLPDVFPSVKFDDQPFEADISASDGLTVLVELVLSALKNSHLFETRDSVSAYPIHSLLVANDDYSLDLAFRIYQHRPSLLAASRVRR